MMKLANLPLIILLIASACFWAVAQTPPVDESPDGPPPPREEYDGKDAHPGDKSPHGWWGRDKPMDEQELREAVDVLKKIDPEKAEKLQQVMGENPQRVGEFLKENFPHLGRFMAWRRFDPDGFDLRVDDLALSRRTHESVKRLHDALDAGDNDAAAFEQLQLRELVVRHFQVRQEIREHDLAKLQEKIAELQAQLQERVSNRDQIIADRLDKLVKGDEDYRW